MFLQLAGFLIGDPLPIGNPVDYWQNRYFVCLDPVVYVDCLRIKIREERTVKIRAANLALRIQRTCNTLTEWLGL